MRDASWMDEEDEVDPRERQRLAEEWRVVGEMLLERSPEVFAQLLAIFSDSAIREASDRWRDISETYMAC